MPEEASTSGSLILNNRPVVMPELFSGSSEDDWETWIANFETCAELNKWEGAIKAKFLAVRLKGTAQRSLQELSPEIKGHYEHLKRALGEKFNPSQKLEQYKAEFRVRRREKGEGLTEFANSVMKLARRAYPDLLVAHQNEIAKDRFVDGLDNKEWRIKLREVSPKTLEDAVSRAIQLEAIEAAEGQQPRSVRAVVAGASGGAGPTDPILELLKQNQATLETIAQTLKCRPSRRPTEREPITCFNCGKQGHKAAECRSRPSSTPRKFGPKSGNRT